MNLTQIAFVIFALVAAGGVTMALMIAAKKPIPSFMPPGHGLAGLVALAVLLAANLIGPDTTERAWWAFGVFAAGFSGAALLFRVIFKNKPPLLMVAGHGSIGAIGLYLLYGVAFG